MAGLFDMPEESEGPSGEMEMCDDMSALASELLAAFEAKDVEGIASVLRSVKGS